MNNKPISNIKNTYQLTTDEKTIPFKVDISDVGDKKINNLRENRIRQQNRSDNIRSLLFFVTLALSVILAISTSFVSNKSLAYHVIILALAICLCVASVTVICISLKRVFTTTDRKEGIKGWNTYKIASEIAFALDNMEPGSEIKLLGNTVKQKDPNTYLQIKDKDTKKVNTYWLDAYSWEVHDKDEIILTAAKYTDGDRVYKMELQVPQWIKDKYIEINDLLG